MMVLIWIVGAVLLVIVTNYITQVGAIYFCKKYGKDSSVISKRLNIFIACLALTFMFWRLSVAYIDERTDNIIMWCAIIAFTVKDCIR